MPCGCLCALEHRKTLRTVSGTLQQCWETHGDPSIQSLSSVHFHFFAIFTDKRGRWFMCMTPCLDDMLFQNLNHLFNAVGQIVCLKLLPIALIQCCKCLLDDYPIHGAMVVWALAYKLTSVLHKICHIRTWRERVGENLLQNYWHISIENRWRNKWRSRHPNLWDRPSLYLLSLVLI